MTSAMGVNTPGRRAKVAEAQEQPESEHEHREREEPQRLESNRYEEQDFPQRTDDRRLDHDVHRYVMIAQIDDEQSLHLDQDKNEERLRDDVADDEIGGEHVGTDRQQRADHDAEQGYREQDDEYVLHGLEEAAHEVVHGRVRNVHRPSVCRPVVL